MFAPINPTKSTIIRTVAIVTIAALAQWMTGEVGVLRSSDRLRQLVSESPIAKTEDGPLVKPESKASVSDGPFEKAGQLLPQEKSYVRSDRLFKEKGNTHSKWGKSGKAYPVAIWKDDREFRVKWSKGIEKALSNSPQQSSRLAKMLAKNSEGSKIKAVWKTGFLEGKRIRVFDPNRLLPRVEALLDAIDSRYDRALFLSGPNETYAWNFSNSPSHKIPEYAANKASWVDMGRVIENTKVSWLNPERAATKTSSGSGSEDKTIEDGSESVASGPVASATNTSKGSRELLQMLFATPDAPGAIAIGAAEGTRTPRGGTTSIYWGHPDPANGVRNLGTFSYQHGASNAREADWIQLKRLRGQVEQLQNEADELGVKLSPLELVAGADLANQSPVAALDYVDRLKELRAQGLRGMEAVLEARIQSFVNPETGVLEAGGFGNSWDILRHDQSRRMVELQRALRVQGIH